MEQAEVVVEPEAEGAIAIPEPARPAAQAVV